MSKHALASNKLLRLVTSVFIFSELSEETNMPFAVGGGIKSIEDIQKIVSHLKNKNIGILITDHNVQETLSITDRTYLLFEGNILKSGTAEELANDEQVRRVYLGRNFELKKKVL